MYAQFVTFERDEYRTAYAKTLDEEEDKLAKSGFEFIRYCDKKKSGICGKRK
jgi:hypothetical protein